MASRGPGTLRDAASWAGQWVSFARLQRLGLQMPTLDPNALIAVGAILADLDRMVNDVVIAAQGRASHDPRPHGGTTADDDPAPETPPTT
jgi:hypothetical protein